MENRTEHPKTNTLFVCSFCDLDFISNEELMLHMQCHNATKPYICTECDKRYAYKSILKRHMVTHRQEKSIFNCNECDYICDNKQNLTKHAIAHSSVKTFTCTKCDYRTISNDSLSKHNREHGHGENYKFKDCDSEFQFANFLTKHENEIHRNGEPFACSICQKLFSNKSYLNIHMRIHITNTITINDEFFFLISTQKTTNVISIVK